MIVAALVFAALFGIAAGVLWAFAVRATGRAVVFLWVAFAVALMQAFALASVAAFPAIGGGGYVAALVIAGLALVAGLCWLASRATPGER